jgi:hypothetical protein
MYSAVFDTGSTTTVDFNNANVLITSVTPPATITLNNIQNGGSYTLIDTCTNVAGQFTFSAAGLTFKYQPANGSTTAGTQTVYTFIRGGSTVYVSWITGF